jgi:hypothetical protein
MLAIILGSLSVFIRNAYQEADWTIFFSLLDCFERCHASGDTQEFLTPWRLAGDASFAGLRMITEPATAERRIDRLRFVSGVYKMA